MLSPRVPQLAIAGIHLTKVKVIDRGRADGRRSVEERAKAAERGGGRCSSAAARNRYWLAAADAWAWPRRLI